MKKRTLGQGLEVSAIGFGAMGLSDFYSTSRGSDADGIAVIRRAVDLGVTLIDTADIYGPFTNEVLVGKALHGMRERVVLATKFGIVRNQKGERLGISGEPDYVRKCCDASLQRLGVDRIDLYYQHRIDPGVPIEDTVGVLADLVKQGKVGHIGLSEPSASTIRRAHAVHPLTAIQTEYSLWSREPEDAVLPLCRELGIGFVPYSPLGRGFLAGKFQSIDDLAADDWRRASPRFQGGNFAKNLALVDRIGALATRKRAAPSQLALAWLLAQGDSVVPIPGTTNIARLEENVGAAAITLDADELAEIEAIAPHGVAAGTRYPEAGLREVNR